MKKLACLACLMLILLSACDMPILSDVLAKSGTVLYFDDFSDPKSGWTEASDSTGGVKYANGLYQLTINTPEYDVWEVSHQNYRDVQVEVDATPLEGSAFNRYGLICRYKDADNYYFFNITDDGYYGIGKVINGKVDLLNQDLFEYSSAVRQSYSQNHIRFDCIGDRLTGYANESLIASTTDADFTSGDAGVIAGAFDEGGVDVVFDNFVVYKP